MKTIDAAKNILSKDGLRKLLANEWSIPDVKGIIPSFFAALAGFLLASAVSIFVAIVLLPKHTEAPLKNKKPDAKTGTASIPPPPPSYIPAQPLMLPPNPLMEDFRATIKRNLFNSEGTLADTKEGSRSGCELKKSDLPLKFTGVIFGGTAETSLVVLESNATKQAETFLLGDFVPGDVQIVDIERDRIILERNSCKEFMMLEILELPKKRVVGMKAAKPETKGPQNLKEGYVEDGFARKGYNTVVEKRWVNKALGIDFAKTLQDAKATPNVIGTEIKGFTLTKIRPDSVWEKMGFQDGDIVESINGIELNGMAQAVTTLNSLKNETNITPQVKRGGQSLHFTVDIRK